MMKVEPNNEEPPEETLEVDGSIGEDAKASTKKHSSRKGGKPVEPKVALHDWGFPGYLTTTEKEIYDQFKAEVDNMGHEWRDTVFSFGENEDEEHAFCRWLRARKFNLKNTLKMVGEATVERMEAKSHDFYPDPKEALGVEEAVFKTQYPQTFYGHAKNGCPIFFSKPGRISINAMECVTTVESMHKYQFHAMIHGAGSEYRARQQADPNFRRFQSVAVLDLEGLSPSTLNNSVMNMIKHQSRVDSLCFPETMNRLIVINAPVFFAATWKIIKVWIDARTASKVEIYSSARKWQKRLQALAESDQIPSDYGGTAPPLAELILKKCNDESVSRRTADMMHLVNNSSLAITLSEHELMDIVVYTKSKQPSVFKVVNADYKTTVLSKVGVNPWDGKGGDPSTAVKIATALQGPGRFKVYGHSIRNRFSAEHYLIVGNITKTS